MQFPIICSLQYSINIITVEVDPHSDLLHICIVKPKNTSSLIDIIATTHENNIALKFVYSSGASDHHLIGIVRKLNTKHFQPRRTLVRNYKGYSKDDFNSDLHLQNWQSVLNLGSFNEAWNGFKTILQSCIHKHAPLIEKTIRGKDSPWLTSSIKRK